MPRCGHGVEGAWSMKRQTMIRDLRRLVNSRSNDAVKLAFLGPEEIGQIDELDLRCLVEFRRSGNGGVELKLVDRLRALELLDRLSQQQDGALNDFLSGLRGEEP